MNRQELYEKALRFIAGFHGEEHFDDGYARRMTPEQELAWAREMAKEALDGIDPTTGERI